MDARAGISKMEPAWAHGGAQLGLVIGPANRVHHGCGFMLQGELSAKAQAEIVGGRRQEGDVVALADESARVMRHLLATKAAPADHGDQAGCSGC